MVVGHDAGGFVQAVYAGELSVAEAAGELRQDRGIDVVEPEGDLVEDGVAGGHETLRGREVAPVHRLPVVLGEILTQPRPHGHALKRLDGGDAGLLKACRQSNRFERGPRRVGGQQGAVQERLAVIVGEPVVLLQAEAIGDGLGVEPGVGGQGQHGVIARVHDNDGAHPLGEDAFRRRLNVDVEGEDDVLAGPGRLLGDGAADRTFGGDRGQRAAALAGQDLIELELQAEGAYHVAGAVALRLQLFQLLGVDLGHVAQDVGGGVTDGVDALRLVPYHHSQVGEGVELVQLLLSGAVVQRVDRDEVVGG